MSSTGRDEKCVREPARKKTRRRRKGTSEDNMTGFLSPMQGSEAVSCEHYNEPSVFTQVGGISLPANFSKRGLLNFNGANQ